jgi:replication-associated recombination protein RarA
VGTLYSVGERAKIEWAIGSIVAGDSKKIQKFVVFYGSAGTGKSTILNIIEKLFEGYTTSFDGKALGSSNCFCYRSISKQPARCYPARRRSLKIDDNTRLNSIISHEMMPMNEKYKPSIFSTG